MNNNKKLVQASFIDLTDTIWHIFKILKSTKSKRTLLLIQFFNFVEFLLQNNRERVFNWLYLFIITWIGFHVKRGSRFSRWCFTFFFSLVILCLLRSGYCLRKYILLQNYNRITFKKKLTMVLVCIFLFITL